jgi:hypothetical protein
MKRFIDGAAVWVAVLGLVVGLSGCGSDPAPSEGTTTGSGDAVNTARGDARGGEVDTMRGSVDVPVVSETQDTTVVPVNPLIAKLPGQWERVVPDDGYPATVTVDANNPECRYQDENPFGSPGDACIHGFSPIGRIILDGTTLRAELPEGDRLEGLVIEKGTELRVEFTDCSLGPACDFSPPYSTAYVRTGD